jgi:competence ComEA-like helix-hairpin-helix protein
MVVSAAFLIAVFLRAEARAGPPLRDGPRALGTKTPTSAVDLNSANAEALMRLPGIGKRRAERIIARRTKRPFRSPEELAAVKGIGPKLYKRLQPFVRVVHELPRTGVRR